jgi:hypothetical protein
MGVAAAGTISTERDRVIVPAGGSVSFGRQPGLDLRIGHAPVYDDIVPRLAGKVFDHDGRLVVANLDDSLALDLRIPGRPLLSLAPGEWHSPRDRTYDIVISGTFTYELSVTVNTSGTPTHIFGRDEPLPAEPPTGARPHLTERQRRILDAYVAPLADGGLTASHQRVADELGLSRSLVRLECNRIWSELLVAGVPMRDLGEARDEIADAWARHRI